MRVDGHRLGLPEPGAPRRVPLPVRAPACPPLRLLAALVGAGGLQDGPEQYRALGHRRGHGGIRSPPPPPAGWPGSLYLRLGDAVSDAGLPAGRGASGGSRRPHLGGAPIDAANGGSPCGPCSPRRRRCSRFASTRASPGTRSGNGASPTSRRVGTRRSRSSPPKRGPCGAWRCWAARSTRPTSRQQPHSRPMTPSRRSTPSCMSRVAAGRPPQWQPCCRPSAGRGQA